ncbi:MAG: hypothetical protein MUE98_00250 [Rhodobacteraceae bacterium]|jgi:hypothetical protein|nr:hypothetical protein [Paracoccaceae bacterium]
MTATETETEAPVAGEVESGRARVRRCLIEPMAEMGFQRRKGSTVADHDAMMAKIEGRLGYMTERGLAGLREFCVRLAAGGQVPYWPPIASVLGWAWSIEAPPPRDNAYVQSLIRSALGAEAEDGGWLVELYRTARRFGPPPNRYSRVEMQRDAEESARRRARVRQKIEEGSASGDDRAWLAAWHRDLQDALAMRRQDEGAGE